MYLPPRSIRFLWDETNSRKIEIIGHTESGRLLKVPFDVIGGRVRPVTGYDAGKRDYALYWRQR
jgi:hypothetical protein